VDGHGVLPYAALLIAAGRLADQFGRVRLLSLGTLLHVAASVVGALAGSALRGSSAWPRSGSAPPC
jgi:MFS family permease